MNVLLFLTVLAVCVAGFVILAGKKDWVSVGRVMFAVGLALVLLCVAAALRGKFELP